MFYHMGECGFHKTLIHMKKKVTLLQMFLDLLLAVPFKRLLLEKALHNILTAAVFVLMSLSLGVE